jgi:hypothetical protein
MVKKIPQVPGAIGASDLYTVGEFQRRLGLSSWNLWRAKRNGLKVYRLNGHHYVLGKDYIEYVEEAGKLSRQTKHSSSNFSG